MEKKKIIEKITSKKEFSQLPKKDVELALEKFDKRDFVDEEKVKFTRDLLRKIYFAFSSQKLLNLKDNELEWFLKKHISTRERFNFYSELYYNLISQVKKKITIFDFGCGINGFSYKFLSELKKDFDYLGVEAVGQFVELQNYYFKTKGFENANCLHMSLFELEKLKEILNQAKGMKVVFLFKVLDSLEMLERDYSKKLLLNIVPLVDKVVLSFATKSLVKRKKFFVSRKWVFDFIKDHFKLEDDFELGSERYVVFSKNL